LKVTSFRIALLFLALGLCSCAPRPKSFNVIVFDATNKRDLHRERVTLRNDDSGNSAVKLVYQIGEFSEDGLQFTLLLHKENDYEALIGRMSGGNLISSGKTRFDAMLTTEWKGTAYMYLVEPL
jgi:hypothetical protein